MKNKILLFTGITLVFCSNLRSKEIENQNYLQPEDSITVLSSPDLINLTNKWASEFYRLNSAVKINVVSIPKSEIADFHSELNIGFISHEYYGLLNNVSLWKEVVGRDVIVPVINSKNPFIAEINLKGISSEKLAQTFTHPDNRNWATLLGNSQNAPVKYYSVNNEVIKSGIKKFLNTVQIPMDGIEVETGSEMIAAIQKDPYAMGFCKLADILDPVNQQIIENIKLMPIDRNGNGKIDYSEQIYDNLNVFSRAVWIGKYPKPLYSNIYAVSSSKPENVSEVAFLKWVLTDGQQFISPNGFNELALNERQTKIDDLNVSKIDLTAADNDFAKPRVILLILAAFVVISFTLDAGLRYIKRKKSETQDASIAFQPVFNENSVRIQNGLYFDKTHTWAFMEKDGLVKIGIDDFLQHVTGSVTHLKLKNPGDKVRKCETVLSIIHEGKQLNINAPFTGIIKEQNQNLIKNSSLINSSPYSEGWIYRIEPSNWMRDIQFLIMGEKYKNWLKEEFSRLKDFLSVFVKPGRAEYAHVILQDGGEIIDSPLADLGPEVWEDFQTNFIDTAK